MELARPFIRLPYAFDAERLAAEVEALPEQAWRAHPSGLAGNSAVPLISRCGGDNDDFGAPMRVTRHLAHCPYVRQVMASFGEVLGRSRLMRLAPGAEVAAHVDFNYHWYTRVRIHVPIVTEPAVIFHCGDESLHMRAGECWIFNSWHRHRVVHGGTRERTHLVIDTAGSSRFWRVVREMARLDPHRDTGLIEQRVEHVALDPGRADEIETEQYDAAPVMPPGELEALIAELVRDLERNTANDPELVRRYKEALDDFSKDWRRTWLLHGYETSGRPRYAALIETLKSRLHRNPRALVTQSNGVGANPIIMQRILSPALSRDAPDQR